VRGWGRRGLFRHGNKTRSDEGGRLEGVLLIKMR
jgi:hypothetical protein